jgi:hypothetical protein
MAKQLREMLTDLRAEIGHSTNVAHGINDRETLLYYLNRTQIQLYQDYDWPQLMITRKITLANGQRYYPYPADLAFDDITDIWAAQTNSSYFNYLTYGIGPEEISVSNSDAGAKAWPTAKWQHTAETNTIEVWPIPDSTPSIGLGLRGTKTIVTMVNDADLATLPDNLIVLFSAVEILQRDSANDAAIKLQRANEAMRRHRVRQASHKRPYAMAIGSGGGDAQSSGYAPAIGLDYIPVGYGSG